MYFKIEGLKKRLTNLINELGAKYCALQSMATVHCNWPQTSAMQLPVLLGTEITRAKELARLSKEAHYFWNLRELSLCYPKVQISGIRYWAAARIGRTPFYLTEH